MPDNKKPKAFALGFSLVDQAGRVKNSSLCERPAAPAWRLRGSAVPAGAVHPTAGPGRPGFAEQSVVMPATVIDRRSGTSRADGSVTRTTGNTSAAGCRSAKSATYQFTRRTSTFRADDQCSTSVITTWPPSGHEASNATSRKRLGSPRSGSVDSWASTSTCMGEPRSASSSGANTATVSSGYALKRTAADWQ